MLVDRLFRVFLTLFLMVVFTIFLVNPNQLVFDLGITYFSADGSLCDALAIKIPFELFGLLGLFVFLVYLGPKIWIE